MNKDTSMERLARRVAQLEHQQASRVRWLWAFFAFAMFTSASTLVWAQSACLSDGSLCVFSAGSPASAEEVNHNFSQLKSWLEAKVGSVGNGVAMGAIATGSITMQDDSDIVGADAIEGYNDLRLFGDATHTGNYDVRIEGDGDVTTVGAVATGTSLTVGTTLTIKGAAFGSYADRSWGTNYTEDTNGFVVASLNADGDGDRCEMYAYVASSFIAADSAHYYTGNDTRVPRAALTFPVAKGVAWRVDVSDTSGDCSKRLKFVPFAP